MGAMYSPVTVTVSRRTAFSRERFDVTFPEQGTVAPLFNSFYHNLDQDAVDLPLSNYIIARDQGKPVTAVPAFPT